jgi:hypothetical protein
MSPTRRPRLVIAVVASALLVGYVVLWLSVDRLHERRSDFTAMYVGATLLHQGHGSQLYDESLQTPLHAALIAPDTEGNLPFLNPPIAAATMLPLTAFSLDTAYRIWSLLQVALLVLAVAVAARAAPWPPGLPRGTRLAACLAALAGVGSLSLFLLGQWDGATALGLAVAYACWRRGKPATGGAVLAVFACIAKPHLAVGLAAYVVARRDRRLTLGAAAGLGAVAAACLVISGPSGCAGFVRSAFDSSSRTPLGELLGFTGLFGSWLGDTVAARALATAATVAACAACAVLGDAWRRRPENLEASLAGATALSLLAAPHLHGHDLSILAPVAVWSIAAATRRDGIRLRWPARTATRLLALWLLVNVAALLDLGNSRSAPPGRVVPWALLLAGGVALTACAPRLGRAGVKERRQASAT